MSQFENLPLPVSRDAQDYQRLVPANSTVEIPVVGEFVYCKFSDGAISVVINGKATAMESGDERRSGGATVFRGVTLINDTDLNKSVIFVIGFGGFDRKIIQGEVVITPGIRTETGKFITDSRYDLKINLGLSDVVPYTFTRGATLETYSSPTTNVVDMTLFQKEQQMIYTDNNLNNHRVDLTTDNRITTNAPDELAGYEIRSYRGTLDKNNDTWIGGLLEPYNRAAALRIDVDANVLEIRASNAGAQNYAQTPYPAFDSNGNMYLFVNQATDYNFSVLKWDGHGFIFVGRITSLNGLTIGRHMSIQQRDGENYAVLADTSGNTPQDAFKLDDGSLERISGSGFINFKYGGMFDLDNRVYYTSPAYPNFSKKNSETWIRTAQGFSQTCSQGFFFRPNLRLTEAEITNESENGQTKVSGQVIRLILELFAGKAIRGDYLDYVYGAKFDNANGIQPFVLTTGGESFSLAEIADDFTCSFPQSVTLTLRNGLFEAT